MGDRSNEEWNVCTKKIGNKDNIWGLCPFL